MLPTEHELEQYVLAVDQPRSRLACHAVQLFKPDERHDDEALFDEVASSGIIWAIKKGSGDINRLHLLIVKSPDLQISCGMGDRALEYFAWGANSWICAGPNLLAEEHVALYNACVIEGDFDKGRRIMVAMMPLMSVQEQVISTLKTTMAKFIKGNKT